jgi:hypothetical protein
LNFHHAARFGHRRPPDAAKSRNGRPRRAETKLAAAIYRFIDEAEDAGLSRRAEAIYVGLQLQRTGLLKPQLAR